MESILITIKKLLGLTEEYTHFDQDIIIHINTILMGLTQIGVGPAEGFIIYDESATWKDYLGDQVTELNAIGIEAVKTYLYLKVRMLFDPPLSSSVAEAINSNIRELEWRINLVVDPHEVPEEVVEDDE